MGIERELQSLQWKSPSRKDVEGTLYFKVVIVQSIVMFAFLTISMDLNRNISFFTPPPEQASCGSTCQGPLTPGKFLKG